MDINNTGWVYTWLLIVYTIRRNTDDKQRSDLSVVVTEEWINEKKKNKQWPWKLKSSSQKTVLATVVYLHNHIFVSKISPPPKKKNPNLFYSESSYPERNDRKNVEFLSFSVSLGGYTLLFKHLSLLCERCFKCAGEAMNTLHLLPPTLQDFSKKHLIRCAQWYCLVFTKK